MHRRAPLALSLAAASWGATGCDRDARLAHDQMRVEGYMGYAITAREGRSGTYDFTAQRGPYGCLGVIRVTRRGDSSSVRSYASCRLDEKPCVDGDAVTCLKLARMYERGDPDPYDPVKRDSAHASRLYNHACRHGDAGACNEMGLRHSLGRGTALDHRMAVSSFLRACNHGSPAGCFNLGRSSEAGRGIERDPLHARRLYALACSQGHAAACRTAALAE